ncbi:hypothetical protein D3C73_1039790 [compost metagenome]
MQDTSQGNDLRRNRLYLPSRILRSVKHCWKVMCTIRGQLWPAVSLDMPAYLQQQMTSRYMASFCSTVENTEASVILRLKQSIFLRLSSPRQAEEDWGSTAGIQTQKMSTPLNWPIALSLGIRDIQAPVSGWIPKTN